MNKVENKTPNISNLATKTALTATENKIPSVSDLVKKNYNTKITDIENNLNNHNHNNQNFDPPNTNFSPSIDYVGNKIRVKFNASCLKQSSKISYTLKKIVNIYIVYEINEHATNYNYPTFICLKLFIW